MLENAEKPGPVRSSSQPAVYSTSFLAIHYPYYRHKGRVHKGGTESNKDGSFCASCEEI